MNTFTIDNTALYLTLVHRTKTSWPGFHLYPCFLYDDIKPNQDAIDRYQKLITERLKDLNAHLDDLNARKREVKPPKTEKEICEEAIAAGKAFYDYMGVTPMDYEYMPQPIIKKAGKHSDKGVREKTERFSTRATSRRLLPCPNFTAPPTGGSQGRGA